MSDTRNIKSIIEALLFATDEPLTLKQLSDVLSIPGEEGRAGRVTSDEIVTLIDEVNRDLEQGGHVFRILKVAGGYQFATRPEFAVWLGRMVREKSKRKLSLSALETLAVIAYKQPVTKPEIEAIRGVNADYVLHSLMERNMVAIVGRAATPGRPLLYGTTRDFLKHFGLNDLSELPKPREIDELLAEAEFEVEKRMMAELEAKKSAEEGEDYEREVMGSEGEESPLPPEPRAGAEPPASPDSASQEAAPEIASEIEEKDQNVDPDEDDEDDDEEEDEKEDEDDDDDEDDEKSPPARS